MNILVDALPTTVTVNGVDYPVRSDFRTCLRIIVASEDDELATGEKAAVLLTLLYPDQPPDRVAALVAGLEFLNGPLEESDEEPGPRVYSLAKDANLIFAAFRQTHGIDLTRAELHWWEFIALFMDLGSDTAFCSIVNLRRRLASGKATREEKDTAKEMGSLFEVPTPDTRTLEEREAEEAFMSALNRGRHG